MPWWNPFSRQIKRQTSTRIQSTTQPPWVKDMSRFHPEDWTGKRYEEWEAAVQRVQKLEDQAFGAINQHQWQLAERLLLKIMEVADPDGVQVAKRNLARVLEKSGQVARSIAYYEQWIAEGFDLEEAFTRLAIIFKKNKEFKKVVEICTTAISYFQRMGKMDLAAGFSKRKYEAERSLQKLNKQV